MDKEMKKLFDSMRLDIEDSINGFVEMNLETILKEARAKNFTVSEIIDGIFNEYYVDTMKSHFELSGDFLCAQNFTFDEFMKFCELPKEAFTKVYKQTIKKYVK